MKQIEQNANNITRSVAVLLVIALLLVCVGFPWINIIAEAQESETRYSDDGDNGIMTLGEGVSVVDNQTITYDYKVTNDHTVTSAPSYGNTISGMTDYCAPMAGTNAIVFYDRWFTNLIPSFTPGMTYGTSYTYYPDMNWSQVTTLINTLYDTMNTNVGSAGTSQADFESGFKSYVNAQGYNVTYTSFLQDYKNVNLTTLQSAISANKVGIIFCSSYNLIYSISDNTAGTSTVLTKRNSSTAHMMMVYGYKTVKYYSNGINFRTDTYLQVSSGYSTGEQGYVLMNEYLDMNAAKIITIS